MASLMYPAIPEELFSWVQNIHHGAEYESPFFQQDDTLTTTPSPPSHYNNSNNDYLNNTSYAASEYNDYSSTMANNEFTSFGNHQSFSNTSIPTLSNATPHGSPHYSMTGGSPLSTYRDAIFTPYRKPEAIGASKLSMESQMYTFDTQNTYTTASTTLLPKRKPGRKTKEAMAHLPILTLEEKKVDRMVKNREAADISRQRRREKMSCLELEAWRKCQENKELKESIMNLTRQHIYLNSV